MKTKILYFILPLLLLASPAKAQYWGVEFSVASTDDPEDFFEELSFLGITYENVITPNISILSGLRLGHLYYIDWWSSEGYDLESTRFVIPLKLEYKFLLSNYCRVYLNGGVLYNINCLSQFENGDFYSESALDGSPTFDVDLPLSLSLGTGFEVGCFRIGVEYVADQFKILNLDEVEPLYYLQIQTGIRFDGNKVFRKKSKIKSETVGYPALAY